MRLFFAIDLQQELKQELAKFPERYKHLAVRWTKTESLHLTLLFVGWKKVDDLPHLVAAAEEVTARHGPFSIALNDVIFGPPDRPARMIWLTGPTPPEFTKLARDLSETTGVPLEHAPTLHLTLARSRETIRTPRGQQLETLSLPAIEVKEFQLVESKLQRGGAEYAILRSFSFAHNPSP